MKTILAFVSTALLLLSAMKDFAQSGDSTVVVKTRDFDELASGIQNLTAIVTRPAAFHQTDTDNLKKQIISFAFFAPIRSHLEFDYEHVVKNQMSFTGALGIIGVGINNDERNPGGVYVKGGLKFYLSPDWMLNGMYKFNDLQGAYFQPELILNYYSVTESSDYYNYGNETRNNYFAFAFLLNFGKQWILANSFSIDVHIGLGYGAGSNDDAYSHLGGGTSALAASAGLTMGIPLK